MASKLCNVLSLKDSSLILIQAHQTLKTPCFSKIRSYGYHYDCKNKLSPYKAILLSEAQGLASATTTTKAVVDRRSANYKPSSFTTTDFLHSLATDHVLLETDAQRVETLDSQVKKMMNDERLETLALLNLIDDIQRLGLSDQFDSDIKSSLNKLACNIDVSKLDLRATTLLFRLLRQNGIWISQDEFERFKDKDGNFMESLGNDIESMLNLYEASHFALEGEALLDEAKTFAVKHLHDLICKNEEGFMANHVMETLELPLQYRSRRVEARRFMETYLQDKNSPNAKDTQALLELAKLSFNMVQSMHRNELQEMSKRWKGTGLASKLNFSRDRLTEAVFFTVSLAYKPELSKCRKALTKVVKFITLIDDIYDVYGHLDELEAFTSAVERWDINTMDGLPEYMKLAFLVLYNTVNELGYEILKEKGHNCIPFLRKSISS